MKKKYMKPSFRVVELQHNCQILSGSDPKRNVPWWDGEGDAPRRNNWKEVDNWCDVEEME